MIKIDGITSVLYDNAMHGDIYKSQGYIESRKNLNSGITIEKGVNDVLRLKINGTEVYDINLLDEEDIERKYSLEELIEHINNQNSSIIATKVSNGCFRITSKYFGDGSRIDVELGSEGSNTYNAYYDLFVGELTTITSPDIITGKVTQAIIKGRYVLDETVNITDGKNDEILFSIDGITKTIKLKEGSYIIGDLVKLIEAQLNDSYDHDPEEPLINVTAEESNGKYALVFGYTKTGEGTISILKESNGFYDLFCEKYNSGHHAEAGTTTYIYPEEGIVAPPEVIETPATLTGRADLSNGVIIDENNDNLKLIVSEKEIEIILDHGEYDAFSLADMLSEKLLPENIEVSLTNGSRNIVFTTIEKGDAQSFDNIEGTAYNTIIAGTGYYIPSTTSQGDITGYSIIGKTNIVNGFVINDENNKLSFNYFHNSEKYSINVELTKKSYADIDELIEELKVKISEELIKHNNEGDIEFNGYEISVGKKSYGSMNYIMLSTEGTGENYKIADYSGGFYENVLNRKYTTRVDPIRYSGTTSLSDIYIVGRENLNKEIVIHPHINDYLIFDFYRDNHKETFEIRLEPGVYNASSIINELQEKLNAELVKKGYPQDMLQVQIGGVGSGTAIDDSDKLVIKYLSKNDGRNDTGKYIIDGVRGSAAYTIFYRAQGEPSPTHTIGIVDLSNGASIKAGVNDTFIMDINGEAKTIVLEEKVYSSEELLSTINIKLKEINSGVTASYYEGRLKLSFVEVGANTIDGIRGNAKGTLFFNVESREYDNPEIFQIGANADDTLVFDKSRISTELMRINTITILNERGANKALKRLDLAINYVSRERGRIGAEQNRLESIIRNNDNYKENLTAAESRIRDLDIAKEVVELTKQKLLEQVTHSVLAQANKQSEWVVNLLK